MRLIKTTATLVATVLAITSIPGSAMISNAETLGSSDDYYLEYVSDALNEELENAKAKAAKVDQFINNCIDGGISVADISYGYAASSAIAGTYRITGDNEGHTYVESNGYDIDFRHAKVVDFAGHKEAATIKIDGGYANVDVELTCFNDYISYNISAGSKCINGNYYYSYMKEVDAKPTGVCLFDDCYVATPMEIGLIAVLSGIEDELDWIASDRLGPPLAPPVSEDDEPQLGEPPLYSDMQKNVAESYIKAVMTKTAERNEVVCADLIDYLDINKSFRYGYLDAAKSIRTGDGWSIDNEALYRKGSATINYDAGGDEIILNLEDIGVTIRFFHGYNNDNILAEVYMEAGTAYSLFTKTIEFSGQIQHYVPIEGNFDSNDMAIMSALMTTVV